MRTADLILERLRTEGRIPQPRNSLESGPPTSDSYVSDYQAILNSKPPGIDRIKALSDLQDAYVFSQLTAESRETLETLKRLESDARHVTSGRVSHFRKENADALKIAMTEARSITIPSVPRAA
jgi:hypothetical protein